MSEKYDEPMNLEAMFKSADEMVIETAIRMGGKYTLSFDSQNQRFIAELTAANGYEHKGFGSEARIANHYLAMGLVKHG